MEQFQNSRMNRNGGIKIKLWEIYLLRNRNRLYETLRRYALDGGPVEADQMDRAMVTFRFTLYDWSKTVRQLLVENNIPFLEHGYFYMDQEQIPARKKVVLVEDDADILLSMKIMLQEAGYDVTTCSLGGPITDGRYRSADLFIIDKRLPDMDGVDTCRALRAHPDMKDTPVIMISAAKNFGKKASDAGATDILEKPFQMKDLLRLVAKHTGNQRSLARV